MDRARISVDYGIVVRQEALKERGISLTRLLELFEVDAPYDHAGGLISFGPHFGQDASDEFSARLQAIGLQYVDDFFVFASDVPPWCALAACVVPAQAGTQSASVCERKSLRRVDTRRLGSRFRGNDTL